MRCVSGALCFETCDREDTESRCNEAKSSLAAGRSSNIFDRCSSKAVEFLSLYLFDIRIICDSMD